MSQVRMTHPDLDGEIEVPGSAVPHHQRAGWQVAPGQDDQGEQWPTELQPFGGQEQVRMRHPDLEGDPITIAASAVPFHRERGWQVIDEQAEADAQTGARAMVENLEGQTVEQLRDLARAMDLPVSGTKAELIERLASAPVEDQAGVEPAQPEEQEA